MFSFLSSNKNKEATDATKAPKGILSRMAGFAGKAALILGLSAPAGNLGTQNGQSTQAVDQKNTISVVKKDGTILINNQAALPPKATILPIKKVEPISSEKQQVLAKNPSAKAIKGQSVGSFMKKNFGTDKGWEGRLINVKTGKVVIEDTTDLIAGETYILASNEAAAKTLITSIISRKGKHPETTPTTSVASTQKTAPAAPVVSLEQKTPATPAVKTEKKPIAKKRHSKTPAITKKTEEIPAISAQIPKAPVAVAPEQNAPTAVAKDSKYRLSSIQPSKLLTRIQTEGRKLTRQEYLTEARKMIGLPYQWGGGHDLTKESFSAVDCSGLSSVIVGVPMIATDIKKVTAHKNDLSTVQSGDIFFKSGKPATKKSKKIPDHTGIISAIDIENGKVRIIEASAKKGVVEREFSIARLKERGTIVGTAAWIVEQTQEQVAMAPSTPIVVAESSAIINTPEPVLEPQILVSTISANDASFIAKAPDEAELLQAIIPSTVPLVQVATAQNVLDTLAEKQKESVLAGIRTADIQEEVRNSVIAKLEPVKDVASYYRENLARYEPRAIEAKAKLPELQKLYLKATKAQEFNLARDYQGRITAYSGLLKTYAKLQTLLRDAESKQMVAGNDEMDYRIAA